MINILNRKVIRVQEISIKDQFYFKKGMKIERKTLTKWEISQPNFDEKTVINPNTRQQKYKNEQLRTMFGLPRSIVESPKLDQLKKLVQDKYANKLNKQQLNEMGPAGKYLSNNLRSAQANPTNVRFRSLKKNKSLLDTYEIYPEYLDQKQKQIHNHHHIDKDEHTSNNTLELLQKIIFKQDSSPTKIEMKMELHANKLPLIVNSSKGLKRKQSQSNYQEKYANAWLNGQKSFDSRPRQRVRPSEKPYLTGWETESRNW